jgi:predicted ArsR family transcriptional regulator
MATRSQTEKILGFLQTGKQLTVSEAQKRFGVSRLAARIHDLRNDGFVIYTNRRRVTVGNKKVTGYRLDNSFQN